MSPACLSEAFWMLFLQGQKVGLHLDTNGVAEPSQAVTAPPNLQPFFDNMADSKTQSSLSSLKVTPAHHAPPSDNTSFHPVTFFLTLITIFFLPVSCLYSNRAERASVFAL